MSNNIKLSQFFTLEEMTLSQTATRLSIDNDPSAEIIENLKKLSFVLDNARNILGKPIIITSGYRSYSLNRAIGGSKNSAHCFGRAADFISPAFGTPYEICERIIKDAKFIVFDQLILEYGKWVHLGISLLEPRQEILTIRNYGEGYLNGLHRI